jgi:hypothetical protein
MRPGAENTMAKAIMAKADKISVVLFILVIPFRQSLISDPWGPSPGLLASLVVQHKLPRQAIIAYIVVF